MNAVQRDGVNKYVRCRAFVTEFTSKLANPASPHARAGLGVVARSTWWFCSYSGVKELLPVHDPALRDVA